MGRLLTAIAIALSAMSLPAPATSHDVDVMNYRFHEDVLEAQAGRQIQWRWTHGGHTVTALDGSFDSGLREAGAEFSATFQGGVLRYRCTVHSLIDPQTGACEGMCGIVTDPFRDDAPPRAVIQRPHDGDVLVVVPRLRTEWLTHDVEFVGTVVDDVAVSAVSLRVFNPLGWRDYSVTCTGCGTRNASWSRTVDLVPGRYLAQLRAADPSANVGTSDVIEFFVL